VEGGLVEEVGVGGCGEAVGGVGMEVVGDVDAVECASWWFMYCQFALVRMSEKGDQAVLSECQWRWRLRICHACSGEGIRRDHNDLPFDL